MYSHIVFDVDGTLLDSAAGVVRTLMRVSGEMAHPAGEARCKETLAMATGTAFRYLGVPEDRIDEAVRRYDVLYARVPQSKVFPGVTDLLGRLRERRIALSVLSARQTYELDNDPAFAGLRPYFSLLMGADYAPPKPSPAALFRYMGTCGVGQNRLLFVGDSQTDSRCAKAAGVAFALAAWNRGADETRVAHRHALHRPGDLILLVNEAGAPSLRR